MISKLLALAVCLALAQGRTTPNTEEEGRSDDVGYGDLKVAYETYKECSATDMASCLKLKLAKALNRMSRSDELTLFSGVTLVKDPDAEAQNEPEQDVETALPRGLMEKDGALDNLIFDKILGFFRTHTLKVKLQPGSDMQRAFEEGRGRRKKMTPLLLIPLLIGGTLIPLAFGGLALLAGKALIVSKLALVLAGIIGLKKLLSGGHAQPESHEVVVQAGHHGGGGGGGGAGWGRSFDVSQNLAYNAYKKQ